MDVSWLDWFGYAASVVILISLTMSSIIKLRWVNLAGAIMFAAFGYLIGSIPTGTLNAGIAIIDIYYLIRLYREREELAIVPTDPSSPYFRHVWQTNVDEISRFFGTVQPAPDHLAFFYLRNNNTAGLLLGSQEDESTLRIVVDFVTSPYRDFRVGDFLFSRGHIRDAIPTLKQVIARAEHREHENYLRKFGFAKREDGLFYRELGEPGV